MSCDSICSEYGLEFNKYEGVQFKVIQRGLLGFFKTLIPYRREVL